MLEIGKQYRLVSSAYDNPIVELNSLNGKFAKVQIPGGETVLSLSAFLIDKDAYVPPQDRVVQFRYNGFEMYGILRNYTISSFGLWAQISNGKHACFSVPFEGLIPIRPTKTKTIRDANGRAFLLKQNGSITEKGRGSWEHYYCPHCGELKRRFSFKWGIASIRQMICDDCRHARDYFLCKECNTIHPREELAEGHSDLCKKCFEKEAIPCTHCGKQIMPTDSFLFNGEHYCKDCHHDPKVFTKCACCHITILARGAKYLEGRPICRHCHDRAIEYDGWILNYHQPYFTAFRGEKDKLHMGVELEIDEGGMIDCHARKVWKKLGKYNAVMKKDGSLDDGFEIISAPATYEAHKNEIRWCEAMDTAIELGYRSHDSSTSGLHVHVDRAYFEPIPKEIYEDKFAMLFGNNADWIRLFSRRTVWHYCQIYDGAEQKTSVEDAKKGICKAKPYKGASHGVAVNYGTDKPTIEIRVFRGTLKYNTFLATLQFVQMFCDFVKHTEFESLPEINLPQFIEIANEKGFTEFLAYLEERNITAERNDESLDTTTI